MQKISDLDADFAKIEEQLQDDLELLGMIQLRESDNLLAFEDWCRIHKLIRKYTDFAFWPSLHRLIEQRRGYMKNDEMENYKEIIATVVDYEEQINSKVTDVVLSHFNIIFEQFKMSYNVALSSEDSTSENQAANIKLLSAIALMRVNLRKREAKRNP